MSEQPEALYSAREVAAQLGLGSAMLRRYASTYETVSGDEIMIHKRDGRMFTETQVGVLARARTLVMQTSTDVETALKGVLEQPLTAPVTLSAQSSELSSAALVQALIAAHEGANAPLLSELQSIRAELEGLRAQGVAARPVDRPDNPNAHGPLVRVALWLEGLLRRQ